MNQIPKGIPQYWEEAKLYLRRIDPVLAYIIDQYEEPALQSRGDILYTLSYSIVGQQISVQAATVIWRRLCDTLGEITAERIIEINVDTLRQVGLSRRKCEYLKNIAHFILANPHIHWSTINEDELYQILIQIKGIGPWTIHMIQIFTLCLPDVLPLKDIAVIRAIEKHYRQGVKVSLEEIEKIADPWRPYRTVAIWYLWRTLDSEPVSY
jgi:DNA-3-methyladenine glycosylase II